MKKYGNGKKYDRYVRPESGVAVGLGNFDGVHLGHRALAEKLVEEARELSIPSIIYTFEKHPQKVIGGAKSTRLIMTNDKKASIFGSLGVSGIYFEDFSREYSAMSPEEFASNIIKNKLGAALVVAGENYSFGAGGLGKEGDLRAFGERFGFRVVIIPDVKVNGTVVSSTFLRKLIKEGLLEDYPQYAGAAYTIPGTVTHGREVGRSLGFPTANILPKRGFVIPPDGVYVTCAEIGDRVFAGVTNIGKNPTFDVKYRSIETFFLDLEHDLYGSEIELVFIKRLRGEIRFPSKEALEEQIGRDVEEARRLFREVPPGTLSDRCGKTSDE